VSADADKLRIVLANLLDNAVSYANPGTEVRVDVAATTIRVSNATALDDASHVFDRFWRADTARTAGHAGLGLALSRKLIEVCGGEITAQLVDGHFVATVELRA
jgi:signal transduction histidine kinase